MSRRYVLINNGKTITIICPIFSSGGRRCCDGFNDFRFNNDTIYWHFTVLLLLLDFWSSSMLQWTCKVGRKQTFFGGSFFCAHQPAFLLQMKKRWFTILLSMNFDKYLIFWIIVLNDMDGIAHFKAQFVHIFLYIFVRRFDTIKNTWWQLGSI